MSKPVYVGACSRCRGDVLSYPSTGVPVLVCSRCGATSRERLPERVVEMKGREFVVPVAGKDLEVAG